MNTNLENKTKAEIIKLLESENIAFLKTDNKAELIAKYLQAQQEVETPKQEDEQLPDEAPKQEEDKQEDEQLPDETPQENIIKIVNNGAFDVVEPHSSTLLKAKVITKITVLSTHNKAIILNNIKQLNIIRVGSLQVLD